MFLDHPRDRIFAGSLVIDPRAPRVETHQTIERTLAITQELENSRITGRRGRQRGAQIG